MSRNKKIRLSLIVIFVILVAYTVVISILYIKNNNQIQADKNNINHTENSELDEIAAVGCSRSTRLTNIPAYDRALSLIEERTNFAQANGWASWNFFPPQLINCIVVISAETRDETGAEGYFIFNDDRISDDYFPITVDDSYSYSDDATTALLLVHEITHVQQYIQLLNGKDKLSCIDKEVEAFYAQFEFLGIQTSEAFKSIDYRIQHDDKLHPQLQILKSLRDNSSFLGRRECFLNSGENGQDCADNFMKNKIKQVLLLDAFYIKQCNL
jgi:hypothetical protein